MMFQKKLLLGVLFLLGFVSFLPATEPVAVMSYNIRYSDAGDEPDSWRNRRNSVLKLMQKGNYDFIGAQEVVVHKEEIRNQVKFVGEKLPIYGIAHRSSDASPDTGQGMLIVYHKDRWEIDAEQQGTFWLSDTPDVPASNTWGAACTRCVQWGLFHEKDKDGAKTGKTVYFLCTHFDHISDVARQKSAELVMRWIAERKEKSAPVILVGDLNTSENSPAIEYLKGHETALNGELKKPPLALSDTFRTVNPDETVATTFNDFRAFNPKGHKIDYIFVTDGLKATAAEIIRTKTPTDRFPSDHFPITAVLVFE